MSHGNGGFAHLNLWDTHTGLESAHLGSSASLGGIVTAKILSGITTE